MFGGRKYQVGIGKESSRGIAVAPSFWLPKEDVTVDNKKQYVNNDSSLGVIHDSNDARIVKEWSEGEIMGKVRDKSFGLLLFGSFGSVSSALHDTETLVYDHTFSVANTNAHQSLTLEVKNELEHLKYALGVVSSLKITAVVGKFVEFACAFKAKKGSASANAVVYTSENEFISKHATLKLASDLAGLDLASAVNIKSFEISINKNIEEHDALGSTEPVDYANKEFSVDGNIEAVFEDTETFKSVFESGTLKATRIDIKSDAVIGSASNPELKIDLASVSLQDWSRKSGNNDIVTQTIKFKAHYSLADAKMIEAVLTNLQENY